MKKISLISSIVLILCSTISLATTVTTDYEGMGDLDIQTTILSPVAPTITDSASITTGCEGGCCCCPECVGDYEGSQIITNNPFAASGHYVSVTEGCVEIEQYYYDEFNNHQTETIYYTYLNGTGIAESYVYAVPGEALSYQFANGTGSAFVSFDQIVFLDEEFDHSTSYGGGVWICGPGYAGLMNEYHFNDKAHYNSDLGLYCVPADDSSLYAFLFAKTTDSFGFDGSFVMDSIEIQQDIEAEGASEYGSVFTSYDGEIGFDFEMELG